jgi:hypothetical protein
MFFGQFAVFAAYGLAAHVRGTGQLSVSETVTTLSIYTRDQLHAPTASNLMIVLCGPECNMEELL